MPILIPGQYVNQKFRLGGAMVQEIIFAFVAGSIPAIIIYAFEGAESFLLFIQSMSPGTPYAWYMFALIAVQFFLWWVNRHRRPSEGVSRLFVRAEKFWAQVSFSLLGVSRLILGALLVILFVYYHHEGQLPPNMLFLTGTAIILYASSVSTMAWLQSEASMIPRDTSHWKKDLTGKGL